MPSKENDINDLSVPNYLDPDDPNLDPENAFCLEGFYGCTHALVRGCRRAYQADQRYSHSGRARRPVLLDKLREKVNRLGLKPNDGHDLEGPVRGFLSVASRSLQLSCVDDFYPL